MVQSSINTFSIVSTTIDYIYILDLQDFYRHLYRSHKQHPIMAINEIIKRKIHFNYLPFIFYTLRTKSFIPLYMANNIKISIILVVPYLKENEDKYNTVHEKENIHHGL